LGIAAESTWKGRKEEVRTQCRGREGSQRKNYSIVKRRDNLKTARKEGGSKEENFALLKR